MDAKLFRRFDDIPWPERSELKFVSEIREFEPPAAVPVKKIYFDTPELLPPAAGASLQRHFIIDQNGVPLTLKKDSSLAAEEFILDVKTDRITISAADESGFRYGACELEDRWAAGNFTGEIRRKPWVKHRISRCFFAPNTRPPLKLDELTDETDYYPDAYLDRLMHERLNGVWITLYLYDMPSKFFPERGKDAPQRLAKLKKVAAKCAEYGIKCYIFMAEPRTFNLNWKNNLPQDLIKYPQMGSRTADGRTFFCTTSEEGREYIRETVGYIFSNVPELGGIINIMTLESSHPCAELKLYPQNGDCPCPRCSQYSAAELYSRMARTFSEAMKKYAPEAEFFGWYYSAFYMPGEPENAVLDTIAQAWPKECTLLYNCETGGVNHQCGRDHVVQDYSLSWPGPSDVWKNFAAKAPKMAAKMQTGCSHENAAVPYLPVPEILFERYRGLEASGNCSAVMQCWYFGSVPGVMNKAAGRLSFLPMPQSADEFLTELAFPLWQEHTPKVVKAWKLFSDSYRNFPETLCFKWFGPLHFSIVYPWYIYPADLPMAPSYTQDFPKNSGDRIGECMQYSFSFKEIRMLLSEMDSLWQKGLALLADCADNELRRKELVIAQAIALQIASSRRLFDFYYLRDDMIFNGNDHLAEMKKLIFEEISATEKMAELCLADSRLGYHSEVESYCFFPEKLLARADLLRDAAKDCDNYDFSAPAIRKYSGESEKTVKLSSFKEFQNIGSAQFKICRQGEKLIFTFRNISEELTLFLEPGRLCSILTIPLYPGGKHGHGADLISGISFIHGENETQVQLDLTFFNSFKVSEKMMWRFNISSPSGNLNHCHPYPFRLWLGTANPEDLLFLNMES